MPPSRHLRFLVIVLACVVLYALFHSTSPTNGADSSPSKQASPENTDSLYDDDRQQHAAVPVPPSPTFTIKETNLVSSAMGFTGYDRLYLRNRTFYIVTSSRTAFPPIKSIISPPKNLGEGGEDDPTDSELQVITPERAKEVLGDNVIELQGLNVIVSDPVQYLPHLYHWWGEIMLGVWRVHAAAGLRRGIAPENLEIPSRFFLPYVEESEWPPGTDLSGSLMRAAFPNTPLEMSRMWESLSLLNAAVVFERAILVNRAAAHRDPSGGVWFKMIGPTMALPVPPNFWEPVRKSIVRHFVGYLPIIANFDSRGGITSPAGAAAAATTHNNDKNDKNDKNDNDNDDTDTTTSPPGPKHPQHPKLPVVTYISRQSTGRRLLGDHHKALVKALKDLEEEGVCEFVLAKMENVSKAVQVEIAARSTIIVGVHGNGLTHQMWMPKSPHSSVFEIFIPQGYTFDYEILARNMGHRHYAVWNDTLKTYPPGTFHQGVHFPEGFHDSGLIVDGPTVANAIRARLREPISSS